MMALDLSCKLYLSIIDTLRGCELHCCCNTAFVNKGLSLVGARPFSLLWIFFSSGTECTNRDFTTPQNLFCCKIT